MRRTRPDRRNLASDHVVHDQLDLGVTGEQSSEHVRVIPGDLQELGANVIAHEKTQFHPVILARSQSLAMKTDLYSE